MLGPTLSRDVAVASFFVESRLGVFFVVGRMGPCFVTRGLCPGFLFGSRFLDFGCGLVVTFCYVPLGGTRYYGAFVEFLRSGIMWATPFVIGIAERHFCRA